MLVITLKGRNLRKGQIDLIEFYRDSLNFLAKYAIIAIIIY